MRTDKRGQCMFKRKQRRIASKLSLVLVSILTYHLTLYLTGQLEVRRLGDLYLLLMIGSALIITFCTPWVVRQPPDPLASLPRDDSDRVTADGLRVARPSFRQYLTTIVLSPVWAWLALFVLERLGRNTGAEVPWSATNLWTPLVLLGGSVLLFGTAGLLHLRNYRRAANPCPAERRTEADDHEPDDRKPSHLKD